MIKLLNKSASNRNNNNKSAFDKNNNNKLVFRKNNNNSKDDRFSISRNCFNYAKKSKKLSKSENEKAKKHLKF